MQSGESFHENQHESSEKRENLKVNVLEISGIDGYETTEIEENVNSSLGQKEVSADEVVSLATHPTNDSILFFLNSKGELPSDAPEDVDAQSTSRIKILNISDIDGSEMEDISERTNLGLSEEGVSGDDLVGIATHPTYNSVLVFYRK